ncbi:MAG: efflux RND transporter periplasmic adaptor subunit [Acidobacteriota bacterium]
MKKLVPLVAAMAVAAVAFYYFYARTPASLVLTGIVATDSVVVSPQIGGQVTRLLVAEGDTVAKGQALAVITPDELRADSAYYASAAAGVRTQRQEGEAALRFQERQTADQIRQAESNLAATRSQVAGAAADVENARAVFGRVENLFKQGVASTQEMDQARATRDGAQARLDALGKQVEAQQAAVELARSTAEQTAMRRSQLATNEHQQDAANAQRAKADVRLSYTEVKAPIAGFVDVRTAREGEVVTVGQPLVTLVNPDDLWVRADVEETYIDRVRLGDTLPVRLPSGLERTGTVFYRGADAAFATQRDVSRTKRDIRTFEIRLRVDNRDRRLAVGMTAYVQLPVQ